MGYGGIDFENVDADKIKEQYEQLKAEREEKEEREANKGTLDRINDTISGIIDGTAIRNAMGETYGNGYDMNPTTYRPLGKIEDIAGDVVDAVQTHTQQRQEFLHNAADMQEKAMNGQLTEEDIDNLRQSGRNARVSLANIAAAPFRQAARNMIQNHAGDNTSPWQPLAQSLEKTDVAQEYFITPAEKAQKSREMEQALGLPAESTLADNDTYREALEMYNFKQKADNMEEVWEKYPELQTIAKDDKEGAVLALHNIRDVKETRSVVDTFMSFLEKGNTELEYNNLQYKIMMGRASEEEKNRAADLKKQIDSSREMKAPGFFQDPLGSMAAGVAGSLPEMGQSVKEGLEGGGVALTLASVAAAVISGGSSVAATAGFAAIRAAVARALASQAGRNLIKTGVYSGMIHGMAAPESGQRYTEYKAMTKADGKTPLYTDDEARIYSLLGGYGNAAIEIANIGVIGKAVYPVATRVFAQSVEQIAKQSMGRETIKDLALGRMGDWFKLTASESGEEALQSVADDVLGNIALASKGEEGAHYKQYSAYDIVTRAGQSFIESLPASMGFATLGTGAGTITGAGRLVRARKRAADMERTLGRQQTQTMMGVMAVEQLQKAVEQGNLNKVAPDVQKKILKEQLANTDFARAYIDVEMAIQKENGREDLQKVAEAAGMSTDELEAAITVNGFIPVETETLAQAKVSPDLLDSVSFSENADSMARMRENSKTIVDDYKKNFEKMVEHQKALADTIIKNYLPENASTEQKETLRAIMLDNPNNPAQAWNKWRKTYNDELQQLIAPALDALKRGMGNAGVMEVEDEQGNKKTQRYTENDEWYRNFYKAFKRKPTAAELQDMAIAMTIGDSNAPKVAGWIPDSAEAQAEMEKNRPIIEGLKNNIELLDSIKSEAKKLTGVEMELTQGLSPEAFKVYRALSSWANKAGGKIARAGRISAILVARHADLFAEAMRKNTGTNYTAEDYILQRLGFRLIAANGTINEEALKQLAGVNARDINATQLKKAKEMLTKGENRDVIFKETGWLQGADGKWRFEIPDNLDKIDWKAAPGKGTATLWQVYDNKRLYEAYPWLSSTPVKLMDMESGVNGRVAGDVYRRIEINRNISDAEKGEALIHEIQHLIQEEEDFATGGNIQRVRQQIQGQIESLRSELAEIPNSKEYLKSNEDFIAALEKGDMDAMEIASEKAHTLTEGMEKSTVDKIGNLSGRLRILEKALQDESSDYRLYMNLAGEQEARATASRAKYMTEFRRAIQEQTKAQLAYEKEVKNQPREMLEKLRELQQLENKIGTGITDEESTRAEQLRQEIAPELLEAFDNRDTANWMVEDKAEYLKTPMPHDKNAIVVFGGQEMSMSLMGQQPVGEMAAEFVKLTSEDMPDVPSGKVVATETLTPIDAAMAAFEKEYPDGETIETPIGDVNINKKGIKASFNHGKIYQAKLDVVPYLVEGMKKAAYLGFEKDFDNRTIANHYFTFPIMYDGVKRFVFCRVRFPDGGKKSFYVHEVFTQEEIKEKSQSLQTQPIPYEKVRQLRGLALYKYILADFYGKNNDELLETLFQRAWHGTPYDFFDDKAIDIIEKYNQQANGAQDEVNGGITAQKQADGRRIISIMETADESTFMHEMAHAFLFDLEELAEIDKGYAKDLAAVNEWAQWHKGAAKEYKRTDWYKGFADIEQAIIDAEEHGDHARAEQKKAEWRQERFARAFESYLKEGNAPAPGLKSVFRMFKQFLQVIYKAFTGDGGKPSEAVRRVMDRMIATDEEIEIAAINDRYNDVMKAGGEKLFDEKQEDTMKRWLAEEKEIAKEKVLKIVMRDLEKKRQQEYADDLAKERERYRDELMQENIFLARNMYAETKNKEDVKMWFKTVEEFDALNETVPDMETLVTQHMQEYGEQLDQKMIDSAITQEEIDKAMNSSKYRAKIERYVLKGMERKKDLMNQINAKARAAMGAIENKLNGLPEDADLQMDKHSNPTIKEIMNEITKLRFASRWDNEDLNHIEAMMRASTQEEVRKALKDLKSRQRQEKQNEQDIEEATKGMEKLYRDLIKQAIANRPMSETCNVKYYKDKERTAERRKAQMAKVKNWEMAIHQQRQKFFYSMMVKQAQENKEARDKMVKDLQKKLNAKTVRIPKDERYWFNRILYIMKINPVNPKMPEDGVAGLDKIFTEQQESFDNIYVPEMLMNIRDAGENFGDYNKMSLQDFRDAYEDLVRLYVVGRDKFNFKSIGGKSIEEVAKEIIYDITKLPGIMTLTRNVGPNQGGLNYVETLGNMGQAGHDAATAIQKYSLSQIKPENILEMLGEKAQKYIYGLLEKAAEKEAKLAEQNIRALQDICGMYTDEERRAWKDQQYDFLGTKGWKITKENVIMMAMNYGSEKNRQRLIGGLIIDGRKKKEVAAQEVQQAIEELFKNTMTAKDWEFVQKLWDHIGSYWHETAAVEEKLNGIALGKVEALPFTIQTADGKMATLKGGYMHIKYDFDKSTRAEEQEINDMAASISAGARRLGIGRGMTKARSEHNIYRELDLHYDVIEQHLQDVIHNIAYRIPVRDIYRLLHYRNDNAGVNMENYMRETVGVEAYRELDAWLMDCWRQVNDSRNSAEKSVNKFLRWMRNNATMAMMGYRVKVALENIGNIPIAMNQIGGAKMLSAMFGFYRHQEENYREVIDRSAFMRTRAENLDRDLKHQPGVFRAENKLVETAKKHAYDMLVITDLMVAAPMWWQVYHESIFPKMKEIQKENEENIAKRMELQQKVDSIRAEIAGHHQGAADIDEHLKIRRYGRPEEIEALKNSEFAGLDDAELRAQWGQHQNEIRNLNKELFKTEQQLEQSMQLPVYTDAEMQEEAINRAVFAADKVVRDNMGSGRIIDQAGVQRSTSELVRLFTAFYSFFNAQWNLIYMSYMKSKYGSEGAGSITKWAPLAKTLMYNVFLSALLTSAVGFALGLKGDDKDEKEKTVMVDGKKEKVEIPGLERFLRVYAKESLSVSTGGLYGIRDITQLAGDYFFSGQNFGYKMGSVATRGFTETARAFDMLFRKGEKDAEIQAQQDKREKEHQEKLAKLKGKKRREYLQKWEEEQKYRKPPKRITYEEILSHGVSGLATVTAAKTGITTTLTDAITHTMMYMMDKDMRYDPAWKNIVWSVIFDKKPVEREIPKKPPTEPKNKKKKKSKQSEL